MSTRSLIGRLNNDGTVTNIYCHHDGYPEGVGYRLHTFYSDSAKVDALMALGDLSSLHEEIGSKHDFDEWPRAPEHEKWCVAYGRDRGETDVDARTFKDKEAFLKSSKESWAEYLYLFVDGAWLIANSRLPEKFEPVSVALADGSKE